MMMRAYQWFRSRLYYKLVLSHFLLLALFLFLVAVIGGLAFRAFAKHLFHENFIRQSNQLFHHLVDELQEAEGDAARRRKQKALGRKRALARPLVRPARRPPAPLAPASTRPTTRPLVRPTSAAVLRKVKRAPPPLRAPLRIRPKPIARVTTRSRVTTKSRVIHHPTHHRKAPHHVHKPHYVPPAQSSKPVELVAKELGPSWPIWSPALQRNARSASRFLLTLVAVLRPDGTCVFETYPPALMEMMEGRRWSQRRHSWKNLLRAPKVHLARGAGGRCRGLDKLQSLRHGKVHLVTEHTLYQKSRPYLQVRYHLMTPYKHRPPPFAILLPLVFVFGLVLLLVIPISRSISRSLQALTETVNKIQGGEMDQAVEAQGTDEVGQLSDAIEKMRVSLLAHQEQRRALLSDVSHEIRTPLARVRTVAESVADGLMREDQALTDAMEGVCQQVDDIDQLLGDILDLSRFGLSKANQLHRTSFTLQALLEEMLRALRPSAEAEQIDLVLAPMPAEPLYLCADRRRLRQVINNLVQNAMRYSCGGCQIKLALGTTGPTSPTMDEGEQWAWIFVLDQGPGVPVEERERIFERLVRLDASRSRHTGGQGLGLAIVSQIVEAHNGEVGVDDAPEGGARFWVRLKLRQAC